MRISQLLDEHEPEEETSDRLTATAPRATASSSELRDADKLVVVAHENPDGDAIGSLVAMRGILTEIGKDCVMFIDARDLPLPQEYGFLPLDGLVSEPPADVDERTIVFLDCGNIERNPAEAFRRPGGRSHILNIDHHHDNTHFGTVNLVVPEASCTAEIVWDLMHALGVTPTPHDRRRALRRADHRHRAASCTRTPARRPTSWPPT